MEQDAEGLLWSSYRTIGAGWPDFYALLREAQGADAEALRLSINALYAHAGANRDHRDLRRRFYYQMLQEKVLPEARRVLLDENARQAYDEQWSLHLANDPTAVSYERFLAALPNARQASSQLDAQIAQELTARLEAQLAAQRAGQGKAPDDEMTADEMGALPVSSPSEAEAPGSSAAVSSAAVPTLLLDSTLAAEAAAPGGEAALQVLAGGQDAHGLAQADAAHAGAAPANAGRDRAPGEDDAQADDAQADDAQAEAAHPMRVRRGGHLLAGAAPALAAASGLSAGPRRARITVGLSNEEMRAIGRRSQRRWMRRSAIRLSLGALSAALVGAGAAWALLSRSQSPAGTEARLQASVENAIARAIARSEQGSPAQAQAPTQASPMPAMQGSGATSATRAQGTTVAAVAEGVPRAEGAAPVAGVAANVPRMRLDTLLQNADFEGMPGCSDGDLKPWKVWAGGRSSGLGSAFAVGSGKEQDARSGRWRLVFWKDKPYEASVSQVLRNLRPGLYQLNAWTKRSGGQEFAGIVVAGYGGGRIHYLVPASRRWTPITIRNIRVTSGQCKIGFYTRSPRGKKWLAVDAVEFQRQS